MVKKIEEICDEISKLNKEKYYTTETLAWDLAIDNVDKEKSGKLISFSDEEYQNMSKSDLLTVRYEILITIFMELLFDIAKIDYWLDDDLESDVFEPDYEKFNIDLFFDTIKDKFKVLGFICFIESEDMTAFSNDKEGLKMLVDDRYCRIVLRNYDNDEHFEDNNVSDNIYYHMKINGLNNKKYKNLTEIYSVIFLNDVVFRINFGEI